MIFSSNYSYSAIYRTFWKKSKKYVQSFDVQTRVESGLGVIIRVFLYFYFCCWSMSFMMVARYVSSPGWWMEEKRNIYIKRRGWDDKFHIIKLRAEMPESTGAYSATIIIHPPIMFDLCYFRISPFLGFFFTRGFDTPLGFFFFRVFSGSARWRAPASPLFEENFVYFLTDVFQKKKGNLLWR